MRNRFDKKIEIWSNNVEFTNEVGEKDHGPGIIKSIWSEIIPQTGSLQKQQASTILSDVTHKIKVRYASGKVITDNMYIKYKENKASATPKEHRFDIKYILDPFFAHEFLEIFSEEIIEK